MDKNILYDYIDACALVKETEEDIRALNRKKKTIVKDTVIGSSSEWPYTKRRFQIEGTTFTSEDAGRLRLEEKLLEGRMENAEKIKMQVEEWMLTIPIRMQRIIRFKVFQRMSWEETAIKIGGRCTGDSVRMQFNNFMKEN